MDKNERARRKDLVNVVREDARRKLRDGLPLPGPILKLFDYLDAKLESSECDNSLRYVRDFIRDHALPEDGILTWLEENGGHCDCEALANAEQVVEEAVPGYRNLPRSKTLYE